MYQIKKYTVVLGMVLLLYLALPFPNVMAQTANPVDLSVDKAFSRSERQQIVKNLLSSNGLQFRRSGERVRGLQVTSDLEEKGDRFRVRANRRKAEVTLVNYNRGKAYRVLLDPSTGVIARQEELPGTPQSSVDEREEAKQIIGRDAELSPLLTAGVLVEGGFAVVPPPNNDPNHRYIQMHLVNRDRRSFLRVVTLDLTTGKVAASIQPN